MADSGCRLRLAGRNDLIATKQVSKPNVALMPAKRTRISNDHSCDRRKITNILIQLNYDPAL